MNKVTLTRKQVEQLALVFALRGSTTSVTIEENHKSGIGASHWATYHDDRIERDFQADITDVEVW